MYRSLFIAFFGILFFSNQHVFSVGLPLEVLSEQSIHGLEQQYPRIIPSIKGVLESWPEVLTKAEKGPVEVFKALDFKSLETQFFPQGYWKPTLHVFNDPRLQELFRPYTHFSFTKDPHLIFLANVLYEVGENLYKENPNDVLFLESAAAIGHAKAQLQMFWVASNKQQQEEAKNYIFCSAAQGFSEAMLDLSRFYEWGSYREIFPHDRSLAKILCQEAADLRNQDAIFRLQVATYTEGMFGEPKNFQQGIRNAKNLMDAGNKPAKDFIHAILNMPQDALEEGNPDLEEKDFRFLESFLDWKDEA